MSNVVRLVDDPIAFLRLVLKVDVPKWQHKLIRRLHYKKVEGLRAEGISAHINEALKEMED
jgi:hypothetical protein